MEGTVLCSANHAPLTPISFLERTALVYPDRIAIVASGSAGVARTWRETRARCLRLAAALAGLGIQRHDVVAVFAQNIPAVCELHFGVPMAGAVICTLNSRLDATMAAVLLRHSEAKVIFVDRALLAVAQKALMLVAEAGARRPVLVLISELLDDEPPPPDDAKLQITRADYEYEHLLSPAGSSLHFAIRGGAPTVLSMIVNATADEQRRRPVAPGGRRRVTVMTGGAPPPPQVLFRMEEQGFLVIHSYGLTETYGPATVCTWKPEWDALPAEERARIKSRQGLHHLGLEADVKDPATMQSVPADGRTVGEVMLRGNTVMSGYYKDGGATAEALAGGWFRSGDLAVREEDGYIKILDRSKDIIISGGENISTIEVEAALFGHPAVEEAAVVGRPDEYWGETPCAFVKLRGGGGGGGAATTVDELMAFCRARLPRYMAPRTVVVVEEMPKTATGKVQKLALRERAKAMGSLPAPSSSSTGAAGRSKL
uniref:Uncharacterized protein n=1 Tax=Oryza punctata TaxID=4537 RepID=A0A0E0JI35_ORYPU